MSITKISPSVVDFDDGITITVDDNSDTLTLTSTDADASVGPVLNLYRNSSSPADSDLVGSIKAVARNDNSQDVETFKIANYITDVSDGTEDAASFFYLMEEGSLRERIGLGSSATVINEDGRDVDFRCESASNANMLVVDAGTNAVGVGVSPSGATFHVVSSGSGVKARFSDNTSETLDIGITSDSHAYFNQANSGPIAFQIGGTEEMRVTSNGLTFNGDTAAANALDDYEEGTWTPVIQGSTANGSFSSTTVYGKYTKVGNLVTANFYVGGTHNGSYTGQVLINGFPYAVGDSGQPSPNCYTASYNVDNNGESLFGSGNPGTTYFLMYMTGTGTSWGALNWGTSTTGASGTTIYFTGTYQYRV